MSGEMKKPESTAFRRIVWEYYRRHGRDLPWRRTKNPYRIFVSEMMLQQTQVDRVTPKYRAFLKEFPTPRALARATLADVLRAWQGLGYNRRGKFLHEAVKMIEDHFHGRFPKTAEEIEQLPGVGHYTARAIATFAYNLPEVFIETNIRTVFLHYFFKNKTNVPDSKIIPYIEATLDTKHPREWYWALMDYGAYLKKEHGNANLRSAHYTKQSKFEGSNRQIRGLIIKTLLAEGALTAAALAKKTKKPFKFVQTIADTLVREGFLKKKNKTYLC
ncbi:A/G-specific adenine glycosylase [Candidatus Kaiserbacteria bacterium]|nr:A/G-specific adenine glycosylase [Candidatus Kaiserbacteria bacterium]